MMSDDVKELISWGGGILEGIVGAEAFGVKMRARVERYDGMLRALLQKKLPDIESELLKLRGMYAKLEEALREKRAAGAESSVRVKLAKLTGRRTRHEMIEEALDVVDAEVLKLLGAIAAKSLPANASMPTDRVSRDLGPTGGCAAATFRLPVQRWVFGALLAVIAAVLLAQGKVVSASAQAR